jgi:arsenite methyltransferase
MSKQGEDETMTNETNLVPHDPEQIVEAVRDRYGKIARDAGGSCCGPTATSCCGTTPTGVSTQLGYRKEELDAVADGADLGLGCGAPISRLALQPGETVLDLGSGGGLDACLAAAEVDMTPEMLDRARGNAEEMGLSQVEFREGRLEALPVEDATVDAVTSNCVINLVPNKPAVFREVARVLRPGGRLVVSDIVLDGELPPAIREDLFAYVGCVAGAMQRGDYFAALQAAGLEEVEVLEDIDYLAKMGPTLPPELLELGTRAGVRVEDVAGVVHSVTYRAIRR